MVVDHFDIGGTKAATQYEETESGRKNGGRRKCYLKAVDDSQQRYPKPQEPINILVDQVKCEHAQAVYVLKGAGWAIFIERALSHLGK